MTSIPDLSSNNGGQNADEEFDEKQNSSPSTTTTTTKQSGSRSRRTSKAEMDTANRHLLLPTPRFSRINFDDWLTEALDPQRPAWKVLQEQVKKSYNKAKSTAETFADLNEFHSSALDRRRHRSPDLLPFTRAYLQSEQFTPRAPTWLARSGALPKSVSTAGSGPYCAPHVDRSQGLERQLVKRYSYDPAFLDNIPPARIVSRPHMLPGGRWTFTTKEFRNAPDPPAGSASEQLDARVDERILPK